MVDIRKLPAVEERVETGPIQFGDDWPGTFIRGDNALNYALTLRNVIQHEQISSAFSMLGLQSLLNELEASAVRNSTHV